MAKLFRLPPECIEDEETGEIYRIVRHYKLATVKDAEGNPKRDASGEIQRENWYEEDDEGNPVVEREERRPVAATLEEARADRTDFYDRHRGWIREGYKVERDTDVATIMADSSSGRPDPKLVENRS